jgi:cytochrome b-561
LETVENLNRYNNLSMDLAVGLIVGTLSAFGLFLSIAFYLRSLRSGNISWIAFLFRLPVSSVSALLLTCAAIGLVSAWAQNGNTDRETGFLGTPNWRDNTLAWHVLLMVGGFFCAQVAAVCCWSLIPSPSQPTPCSLPKAMHGLLQVAAMSAMIAGLYAIVRHMFQSKAPSLTTMHSWVGVASIAVYGVAMLWGAGTVIDL